MLLHEITCVLGLKMAGLTGDSQRVASMISKRSDTFERLAKRDRVSYEQSVLDYCKQLLIDCCRLLEMEENEYGQSPDETVKLRQMIADLEAYISEKNM